jgi:hypothetical protein
MLGRLIAVILHDMGTDLALFPTQPKESFAIGSTAHWRSITHE